MTQPETDAELTHGQFAVQHYEDMRRLEYLTNNPAAQQESIYRFILNCSRAAHDLKQMCDARRCASHPVDTLEEPASYVTKTICDEFRRIFGRPLLDKSVPVEVVEQLAVALAEIAGGPWCECDKCRTALAALTAAAPYRKHTNG